MLLRRAEGHDKEGAPPASGQLVGGDLVEPGRRDGHAEVLSVTG